MTTKQQDCTVFNCSEMYASKCSKNKAPDFSHMLQNYSINSLIANGIVNEANQPNKQDLFGLNSPRGLLGSCYERKNAGLKDEFISCRSASQSTSSTPPSPISGPDTYIHQNYEKNVRAFNSQTPIKRRHCSDVWSSSSTGSTRMSSNYSPNSSMRSTSLSVSSSDSSPCNSNESSPSVFEHPYGGNIPEFPLDSDNSAVSSPDGCLTEILNTLTLNESFLGSCLKTADLIDLQNISENHPLLQRSSSLHTNASSSIDSNSNISMDAQLDRAARFHRTAAFVFDATCTWSGTLPERQGPPTGFSSKVFLGGVPWDISEQMLIQTFKPYGQIRVEWPGKDKHASQPKGYVYIIFESEKNVRALLHACTTDFQNIDSNLYFKISSKRMRAKDVQVIPWLLNDSNFTKSMSQKLDGSRTVFVGALHGMLNAEGLAKIMNDLFDGVVYAGIDTDKYKYPIGSGRVTFNNSRSYMKAVAAAFVEIKTAKFSKKVQIDPYLEDALCSVCGVQQGPYFCRELCCFRYFCRVCWSWQHAYQYKHHNPLMRNSKNSAILGLASNNNCNANQRSNRYKMDAFLNYNLAMDNK